MAVRDPKLLVRRDYVDLVCFQLNRILDLREGRRRSLGKNGRHLAAGDRVEMHDDDEGRTGPARESLEARMEPGPS